MPEHKSAEAHPPEYLASRRLGFKEFQWSLLGILLGMLIMGGIWSQWPQQVLLEKPIQPIPAQALRLQEDVVYLTELRPFRNAENPDALEQAAHYIRHAFESATPHVIAQKYPVNGHTYQNIIASFGPLDQERWVVGAHYDVAGNQSGADDNTSGVAGLLELARLLKDIPLRHRIDLVAYTLEEPPYFRTPQMGSAIHVQSLLKENARLKGMINLEMIGYYSESPDSQRYPLEIMKWFYPNQGNFIAVIGKWGQESLLNHLIQGIQAAAAIEVQGLSAPSSLEGIDFSDHLNYWQADFPAVMVTDTSFYRNPNYHLPSDTPDTLDYVKMAEVVKGVYWSILHE